MTAIKLAVPTMGAAGLDAERSGHFGHCDCFTLLTIEDGEITEVAAIDNPPHEEGGCLRPVGLLQEAGADGIMLSTITDRLRARFKDFKVRDLGYAQMRQYMASTGTYDLEKSGRNFRVHLA